MAGPRTGLAALLAVATACSFAADYRDTAYQCDPSGACPPGFECRNGTCVPEGTPEIDAAVVVPDAGLPDAGVSTACGTTARLVDDFDDGVIAAQWGTFADTGTEALEQDGQIVLRVTAGSGDAWAGYYSTHAHDLTGSHARARVTQVGPQFTVLEVRHPNGARAQVVESSGNLEAGVYGMASGNGVRASVTYDPDAHRWWRLRELGGELYWEVSADGAAWVELHREPSPFPIEHIRVILAAGGAVAADAEAHMDDVNPDGDPTQPWCPITDASDDFADGEVGVLWADSWETAGCTRAEAGGVAAIEFDGTADAWCGYESYPVYDACNGHALLEIPTPLDVASAAEMWFDVYLPDGRWAIAAWEGLLRAERWEGDVKTMEVTTSYDTAAHRWWRIRTDGATAYWETSPDGADWTTHASGSIALDCSTAFVGFGAGLWTTWAAGATTAGFDNFNTSP